MRIVRAQIAHGRITWRLTVRRRARCKACSRCGPAKMSDICRRSIFVIPQRTLLSPIVNLCLPRIVSAMSASRWRRFLPADPYLAEDAAAMVAVGLSGIARVAVGKRRAGRIRRRALHRSDGPARRIWRSGCCDAPGRAQSSNWSSASGGIRASRWRPAGAVALFDRGTRHAGAFWRSQSATSHAGQSRPNSRRANRNRCISRRAMSAAGFGIRGELYPEDVLVSPPRRSVSACRSNGWKTGASIFSRPIIRANSYIASAPHRSRTDACWRWRMSSSIRKAVMCGRMPRGWSN